MNLETVHVQALLVEHRQELVGFVQRRAGHLVDPDDLVQQAAVRALAAAAQLEEPSRGRAWLFRIVRNVLADELRGLGLPAPALEKLPVLEDESASAPPQSCTCALAMARRLRPDQALLLERVVLEEAPITRLAGELGVTPNLAMVRLHRARQALRKAMLEHCGTTSVRGCLDCVCEERGCCALR